MKKFNLLPYILVFLGTFLILQTIQAKMAPDPILSQSDIGITVSKDEIAIGKDLVVVVQNNLEESITLTDRCPEPLFDVYRYRSEGFEAIASDVERNCDDSEDLTLTPGDKEKISLQDYAYSYFGEVGRYKLELAYDGATYSTPEFEIKEPGLITRLWRTLIYNPILNALVAVIIYLPTHSLGWSVILLTLAIRTILLVPSIRAVQAQRALQDVQPKLEALKKKYKDDQARLAQETMLIWKQHKVNPLSSCLPMLVQLPILLALFYVVQSGLSPDRSGLIYDFLPEFSLADIDPLFLGFNLLDRSLIVLPLLIGALQFLQMQLIMFRKKKNGGKKSKSKLPNEIETANKMMKYVMPLMIAFFTSQLPAAVGLYWGTSTFYGILQQLVVNKRGSSPSTTKTTDEEEVKVRVINKSHGKKD